MSELAPVPEQFFLTIGDIGITRDSIVTPNGTAPLKGSQWIVADQTTTQQKIPTFAIVLAVVFAIFCLLGLLFLLMKEEVTTGYVMVTVRSGDVLSSCQIPCSNQQAIAQVRAAVAQAQSAAASA